MQYLIKKDTSRDYLNTISRNNYRAYFLSLVFILIEFTSRTNSYLSLLLTISPFFFFRKIKDRFIYLLFLVFLVPKLDRLVLYNIVNNLESNYFSIYDIKFFGINLILILTLFFLFYVFFKSKTILFPRGNLFLIYTIIIFVFSTLGLILNGFDVFSVSAVIEEYFKIFVPILFIPIIYFFKKEINIKLFFKDLLVVYIVRGLALLVYDFFIGNFTPNSLIEVGFCLPIFLANYQVRKNFIPRFIKYMFFLVVLIFNGRGPILIFIITFLMYLSLKKIHIVLLKAILIIILIYLFINILLIYFPEYFAFISFKFDIINEISKGALSHSPKVRALEFQLILQKNMNNFNSILFGQGPGGYIEGIGSILELNDSDYSQNEIVTNKYYKVHSFVNSILLKNGLLGLLLYLILPVLVYSNKLGTYYKYLSYLAIPTIIYSSFWRIDVTLFLVLIIFLKQNIKNENTLHLERSATH